VVIDAGLKVSAVDRGAPRPLDPSMRTISVSDEHAKLTVGDSAPRVGDRILLLPGHVDPTMNLSPAVALVSRVEDAQATHAGDLEVLDLVPVDGRRTLGGTN
jgi:D-serine deaminase-like pyridoxal phosphate-dependent protein